MNKTTFFEKYFHISYISMNIVEKNDFFKLPRESVYAVVDLAGYMPARSDGDYIDKMLNVNLMGTVNILNYCVEVKADRILFAQSFGDILPHASNYPTLTVNMPRTFSYNSDHTVYLIAKCAAVDLIEYYHQHYGLKKFIFRLPTIYLYAKERYFYRDGKRSTLWYRVLIDKAIAGEDMEIWGDPTKVKDMVYVKDFAQLLFLGIKVDRNEGFYNVGTGVGTSLEDQIKIMANILGGEKKSKISSGLPKKYFLASLQASPIYSILLCPLLSPVSISISSIPDSAITFISCSISCISSFFLLMSL